jgi:N-acetylmuramoyl-L-alanine amidase
MSCSHQSGLPRRGFLAGAVVLGAGAGLGLAGATPASAVTAPTIHSCANWSARPPSSPVSLAGNNPNKIIVHHTAFANTADATLSASYTIAHKIQDLHMDTNGWIDSGQHFTISRGGFIMEGRHRSLERLQAGSNMVVGAHCVGQNTQSIGIENNGTYITVAPPTALWNSLVKFCAYICQQYRLDPSEIYGHRDYNDTQCPGDVLYGMIPQLKQQVAAAL